MQNSTFSYSMNCGSTVLCVTSTENSVLASEHLQSEETPIAELVSQRNEIFFAIGQVFGGGKDCKDILVLSCFVFLAVDEGCKVERTSAGHEPWLLCSHLPLGMGQPALLRWLGRVYRAICFAF